MAGPVTLTLTVDVAPALAAIERARDALRLDVALARDLLDAVDEAVLGLDRYIVNVGDLVHAGPLATRGRLIRARTATLAREAERNGYAEIGHVEHVLRGAVDAECTDCVGDLDEKP